MSGRVCYLSRSGRGDRPAAVRLVSAGSDAAWAEFSAIDSAGVQREIEDAAGWLAERAGRGDGPRAEIEVLCVDVEGGACAWVTSPSPDAVVVGAALSGDMDEWSRGTERSESSVQALAAPAARARRPLMRRRGAPTANGEAGPEAGARKLAVLMVPDVPARLLVDALDERGVAVNRVVSLWQALSLAWDPAGPAASGDAVRGERVVASSAPVSAVVLIDPAGKLVWSWSREGELVAGGTLRLAGERREGAPEAAVRVGAPEVSRLVNDWIAWSVQLGQAPRRVLCLGPDAGGEDADSLAPSALGSAVTRAWPGATVDLVVHEDPVAATMMRLARAETPMPAEGARTALVALTNRPGRAHRAMFRWAGAAILALAAGLVAVGWRAWAAGSSAREAARAAEAKVRELVQQSAPAGNGLESAEMESDPRLYLQKKIGAKRQALNPAGTMEQAKPILPELETLSYVFGSQQGVEIEEIQLLSSNALAYILVPDTQTYETVLQSLSGIGGSHVQWVGGPGADMAGKKRYLLQGKWIAPKPAGGAP